MDIVVGAIVVVGIFIVVSFADPIVVVVLIFSVDVVMMRVPTVVEEAADIAVDVALVRI